MSAESNGKREAGGSDVTTFWSLGIRLLDLYSGLRVMHPNAQEAPE
jgi:hypothetical protein